MGQAWNVDIRVKSFAPEAAAEEHVSAEAACENLHNSFPRKRRARGRKDRDERLALCQRHENVQLGLCQSGAMGDPGIVVQSVGEGNLEASVQFLTGWVSDGAAEARAYLADHADPAGASLIAVHGDDVAGYVAILWESNYGGFRDRGIPLVHQLAVAGPFRRQGVATLLMDAAEQLACERGVTTLGITVGLFDEYGPAQRLYGQRGYVPDGRGACRSQRPLGKGMQVTMDHDLIMWLTKDLARFRPGRPVHTGGRAPRRP
jgi:GNAT superfamily N-acetyltransferase